MRKEMNKMILLLVSILMLPMNIAAEEPLSAEGRGHFKAALALIEVATSIDEYEQVAAEFEKVVISDPDYADTYINLCKIYGRIGAKKGESYFEKAEAALEKYRQLVPNDTEGFSDELMVLNAMKEKYKTNKENSIFGVWVKVGGEFHPLGDNFFCPATFEIVKANGAGVANVSFNFDNGYYWDYNPSNCYRNISVRNGRMYISFAEAGETEYDNYTVGKCSSEGRYPGQDVVITRGYGWYSEGEAVAFHPGYRYQKTAVREEWIISYSFEFSGEELIVRFNTKLEYYAKDGTPLFYALDYTESKAYYKKSY